VLGLTFFFRSVAMRIGIAFVYGRITNRFGFRSRMATSFLTLLDVLDLPVLFFRISVLGRRIPNVPARATG
jgi:hypothetical protein